MILHDTNFEGLSRKKYEVKVIQDAELSRIPNPAPNLSQFNVKMCCSSSSWSKRRWSFWGFCVLFSSIHTKSIFDLGSALDPAGEVYDAPQTPWSDGEGDTPPHTSPSSTRLHLGVVATSKSVPNFRHRFIFTLHILCDQNDAPRSNCMAVFWVIGQIHLSFMYCSCHSDCLSMPCMFSIDVYYSEAQRYCIHCVSKKFRTLVIFSNNSNKYGPMLITFGRQNRHWMVSLQVYNWFLRFIKHGTSLGCFYSKISNHL